MGELMIRRPHYSDVVALATNLRQGDRNELEALEHYDPLSAVQASVRFSTQAYSVIANGEVLCIFGVGPWHDAPGVGVPWLLAAEAMRRHARTVVSAPAAYIPRMLAAYPRLVNFVHAENAAAIRWLSHLGFAMDAPAPHGKRRALFRRFELARQHGPG